MKSKIASAVALSFALGQAAVAPAYAEQTASEFRTVERQAFTAADLERYGLDADAAARAVALQDEGYEVKVLSTEEAEAYTAGITDNEWLMIGILIGVVVIAVAVVD